MKGYYETNNLAEELRREWGIDNYSPIDIFSLVTDKINNLTILFHPIDNKISGCCCKYDGELLILINSNHSKGRQNFTLAHELYHLKYENNNEWLICSDHDYNDSEKEANNFASSLLMPIGALSSYKNINGIKNWNLENIIKCEQFFQMSHSSMLYRLKKEKYISSEDYNLYLDNIKKKASKLGFSTELYDPSPKSKKYFSLGNYIRLTEEAFDKNKISIGKKDEMLLDVFRSDIVYNLNEDDFFEG
ncbi:ImmA/IrrE family metallo-endopeptidase [Methanobrevibacter sp. OttesenSCG-928-K11]|nr:ImmA/IrrE family metallo-endopeptidase [Methanobrevibacter sp. OttesenSCG-928-K11]MDL2270325.1 ImmA/IrrE family metallo-endopeptidase [Methanobrevibacter sp. OttesenSCG-928-I08]